MKTKAMRSRYYCIAHAGAGAVIIFLQQLSKFLGTLDLLSACVGIMKSTIVFQSGSVLARGVTTATRYCAIRRQFQGRGKRGKRGSQLYHGLDSAATSFSGDLCSIFHWKEHDATVSGESREDESRWSGRVYPEGCWPRRDLLRE